MRVCVTGDIGAQQIANMSDGVQVDSLVTRRRIY
jgi:hypothetical protein